MLEYEFGPKIKELRKLRGLTQKDIAVQLGITPTQVSDLENGKTSTTFSRAIALAKILDTSLDYLAGIPAEKATSEIETLYSSLTHEQQMKVLGYIDALKNS